MKRSWPTVLMWLSEIRIQIEKENRAAARAKAGLAQDEENLSGLSGADEVQCYSIQFLHLLLLLMNFFSQHRQTRSRHTLILDPSGLLYAVKEVLGVYRLFDIIALSCVIKIHMACRYNQVHSTATLIQCKIVCNFSTM